MDTLSDTKRPLMTDAGLSAAVEAVAIDEYGDIRNGHVAAERALTLYLNKQELVTLMTLGTRPEMLVLGWLRNQRLILDIEQIKAIQVDWETDSAAITTYEGVQGVEEKMARKTVTTGCGQGTVFGDLMDDLEKIELPRRSIRQSEIYRLLHTLNEYNQVYQRAGAVHGCALCSEEQIHLFIEDVGRHNAVDTIAGHMWLEETDGSDKIFYTTGRLTSEMVIKVAQMGIPVLLSRSGITQMGLELARKVGVTLIARAKGRHFLVYNGADQISFDAVPEVRPQKSGARQAGQSKSR
ncbi:MAG: formate dehydrogenase accessory sulfurtransferase FdhD [Candidatus Thiodiazotropha endolucinida]